ncbi:MAG: MFS transporter [archaeon]|nr:MFS transporter [archaeon]
MGIKNNKSTGYVDISKPVATSQKIYYGMGTFGSGLIMGIFGAACSKFFLDIVGMNEGTFSIVWLIYLFWNSFNDLIAGYLSDSKTFKNKKIGHRLPWMRIFNPIMGISFAITWFCPIGDTWRQAAYLFMVLFLYDGAFTISVLNQNALLADMHPSTIQRSKIQLIGGLFSAVASIGALVIPSFVLTGDINLYVLQSTMVVFGIIGFLLMEVCAYKVKIREIEEPEKHMEIMTSIKESVKNISYMALVICNFAMIFMSRVLMGGLFYFTEYVLGVTGGMIAIPMIFFVIGVGSGGFFLMRWIRTIGVKNAQIRGIVIASIGFISLVFLPGPSIYIGLAACGGGVVVAFLTFGIIVGEIADEDEVVNGSRREGMFYGFNALVTKPAESFAQIFIAFMLANWGYISPIVDAEGIFVSQPQSDYTVLGIKIMFGLVPGIFIFLGVLIFWKYYSLNQERMIEVKEILAKKSNKNKIK